jgi:RNA polymerase sigma factor (sigma-70 family)
LGIHRLATALTSRSDRELLDDARTGDRAAFQELYHRHRGAALRLARSYRRNGDADDLVNGAFERVLAALLRGSGPTDAFRPYLFVTLRRLAMEDGRRPHDETLDEVPDSVTAAMDLPPLDGTERDLVIQAFAALPERWQAVLWLTEVEGRQPREVGRSAGLPANTVAVLAHRARERLRQTYLQAHLQSTPRRGCEPHRSRLGGYVRGGLSRRHRAATADHLAHCASCRDLLAELDDVNRLLVRSVVPLFMFGSAGKVGLDVAGGATATATLGGSSASLGAPAAGVGTGAGGVSAAAKVGAAVVAAVAALTVTIVPFGGDRPSDERPTLEAGAPADGDRGDEPAARDVTAGGAQPPQLAESATEGDEASTSGTITTGTAAPTGPAAASPEPAPAADSLVDLGLGIGVGPDLGVGVDVEAGPDVTIDATWALGLLGSGRLDVAVRNSGTAAVPGLVLDIRLSPDARVTSLLGTRCAPAGGLDVVLGLLRSLTCGIGDLAAGAGASLGIPLQVAAAGQTATMTLRSGAEVLDTTVVDLPAPG